MTLRISDKWVWEFWFTQDVPDYHIFYLQAPRSLGDESLRHWHVSIGHAVSQDLLHWEVLPDALVPSTESGTWDNYTTWTGSIIKHAGTWYLFYTGSNREEDGKFQRIGLALIIQGLGFFFLFESIGFNHVLAVFGFRYIHLFCGLGFQFAEA